MQYLILESKALQLFDMNYKGKCRQFFLLIILNSETIVFTGVRPHLLGVVQTNSHDTVGNHMG